MDETLPLAEIAHEMPGRTRLRISDRRGDDVFFAAVAAGLSAIPGVSAVKVAPLTGSVLIRHYGPLARIRAAAQEARLFVVGDAPPIARPLQAAAIDPKVVLALGLAAAALWQLSKERVWPPALTLLWYAGHLGGLLAHGEGDGEE